MNCLKHRMQMESKLFKDARLCELIIASNQLGMYMSLGQNEGLFDAGSLLEVQTNGVRSVCNCGRRAIYSI